MPVMQMKTVLRPISQKNSLAWKENVDIQRFLDVVVSIIADEYTRIAKQNPEIFSSKEGKNESGDIY
jgi:hypothetical protein